MKEFKTFEEALNYYTPIAEKNNLREIAPKVADILEQKQLELENAEFEEEIIEIRDFSKTAVQEIKARLLTAYGNHNVLSSERLIGYLEYKKLYSIAERKLKTYKMPEQLQKLFEFIDFLDVNKAYFIEQSKEEDKLFNLRREVEKLEPHIHYKDKLKEKQIFEEQIPIYNQIMEGAHRLIKSKVKELGLSNGLDANSLYSANIHAVSAYIEKFENEEEIPIILEYKKKFETFRQATNYAQFETVFYFHKLEQALSKLFDFCENEKPKKTIPTIHIEEEEKPSQVSSIDYSKYNKEHNGLTAKEFALAYLFRLNAYGQQVPRNRLDDKLDAKELKRIGAKEYGFAKGDTFYRAVKNIKEDNKYKLNSRKELEHISKGWLNAVLKINNHDEQVKSYLEINNLLESK